MKWQGKTAVAVPIRRFIKKALMENDFHQGLNFTIELDFLCV